MLFSTVGLIAAMVIGMIYVNIGIRKGWCKYVTINDKNKENEKLSGVLDKALQCPIGIEKVNPASVNNLAFQISLIALAIWIGSLIMDALKAFFPVLSGIPNLVNALIGAIIVWDVMLMTKTDNYLDKKTLSSVSGLAVEVIIVSATATLNLTLVSAYVIPLAIYCVIMIAIISVVCFMFSKRWCNKDWFEKFLFAYGAGTGAIQTGIALVRAADPRNKGTGMESGVIGLQFCSPLIATFPVLIPTLLVTSWGTMTVIGIGLAITAVGLILGILLAENQH